MDKESLEKAARASTSYRRMAQLLGTNHHAVKRAAEDLKIDVAHFDFGRRSLGHVGKRINRLLIREVFKKTDGRWFCRCDCQCGSLGVVKRLDGVLNGHVPSCGCAVYDRPSMRGAKNPSYTGCGELSGSRVYWIKRGAERRGLNFAVTKEFLWELFLAQEGTCVLSGIKLVFGGPSHSHETTASLDRIDSSKDYVEGNLQWVHKDVNKIKRDLDQKYFLSLCRRICGHLGHNTT